MKETTQLEQELKTLSLSEIAGRIYRLWKPINYAAKPYLEAMTSLDSINDNYINDSGRSIVSYFLGNATQWKGPEARSFKAELNRRVKSR